MESSRAEPARGSARTGLTKLEPSQGSAWCRETAEKRARGSAREAHGSLDRLVEPNDPVDPSYSNRFGVAPKTPVSPASRYRQVQRRSPWTSPTMNASHHGCLPPQLPPATSSFHGAHPLTCSSRANSRSVAHLGLAETTARRLRLPPAGHLSPTTIFWTDGLLLHLQALTIEGFSCNSTGICYLYCTNLFLF
jgi:hypothetical protein